MKTAIFTQFTSEPIHDTLSEQVYRQYLTGTAVDKIAKRFSLSAAATNRLIRDARWERVQQLPLDFMPNAEFEAAGAEKEILAPMPAGSTHKARRPADLPGYLASLYDVPLLTSAQERHVFRKYNYLKYRASLLRSELDPLAPKSRQIDEIERWYAEALATKNLIIQSNLRLVVSVAKRYVGTQNDLFDLISDGNISLMKAVEKFDYGFGFKFSTYASWAIKKNFARSFVLQFRHHERFHTSHDEVLATQAERRADPQIEESRQHSYADHVRSILNCLDERERQIINRRFGLRRGDEPQTLKDVGKELGVSKERIRQIEMRAMSKLRAAARERNIELTALGN